MGCSSNKFEKIEYEGKKVIVRSDLKGKHDSHSLCNECTHLGFPDSKKNCPTAQAMHEVYVKFGVLAPVYMCPNWVVDLY